MDIKTEYILQAITNASNNLRLSSEKIEVVTLVREHLAGAENLEEEISRLKKITEFSKFAVRLDELYNYISGSLIDFNRISDQFREHTHYLVRELSNLLDVVTPVSFKSIVERKGGEGLQIEFTEGSKAELNINSLSPQSFSKEPLNVAKESQPVSSNIKEEKEAGGDELVVETGFDYDNFVTSVLTPVKEFDRFLQDLEIGQRDPGKLEYYYDLMLRNINLSRQAELEIVAKMHRIISKALRLIRENEFTISKENIESLRSCLIVIVAVVRQKDVDISTFLDKAERLNYLLEEN